MTSKGPQEYPAKRLIRVLQVLRMIEAEPAQWTRAGLCERFSISSRVVDNDVRLLRWSGYDVRRRQGGYELAGAERVFDYAPIAQGGSRRR